MNNIEGLIAPIVAIVIIFGGITASYLISKKYPKLSRELHKRNCHCNVCYPNDEHNKQNVIGDKK